MQGSPSAITLITQLAALVSSSEYEAATNMCSKSLVRADDLRKAVEGFGKRLIAPPRDAYSYLEGSPCPFLLPSREAFQVPLWTQSGRSDMNLLVTLRDEGGAASLSLHNVGERSRLAKSGGFSALPEDFAEAIADLMNLFAMRDYDGVIASCQASRPTADDLQRIIEEDYRLTIVPPPKRFYTILGGEREWFADRPTWEINAPFWTESEGLSDLYAMMLIEIDVAPRISFLTSVEPL